MATLQLIELLQAGVVTSAGAAVASGKVRFYEPATLTPKAAYGTQAGGGAVSVPLTLSAGGQATVYISGPTRMIVKDSTETTTCLDTVIGVTQADTTYVTSTAFNAGAETRVSTIFDLVDDSFGGTNWKLKPSGASTELTVLDFANGVHVDIRSFGAVGDDATDCRTAIQNAINYVESLDGGVLHVPPGIFRCSGQLDIDFDGIVIAGSGPWVSTLKFTHTGSGIVYDGGAGISDLEVRDITITTTSGAASSEAIEMGSGVGRVTIRNVTSSGFDVGIGQADGPMLIENCYLSGDTYALSATSNMTAIGCTFTQTVDESGGEPCTYIGCNFTATPGLSSASSATSIVGGTLNSVTTTSPSAEIRVYGNTPGTISGTGSVYSFELNTLSTGAIATTAVTTSVTPALSATIADATYHYRGTGAGITITVNAPTGTPTLGRKITIMHENSGGGAITWTPNAIYKTSAAIAPATGNVVSVVYEYETRNNVWREVARATTAV